MVYRRVKVNAESNWLPIKEALERKVKDWLYFGNKINSLIAWLDIMNKREGHAKVDSYKYRYSNCIDFI